MPLSGSTGDRSAAGGAGEGTPVFRHPWTADLAGRHRGRDGDKGGESVYALSAGRGTGAYREEHQYGVWAVCGEKVLKMRIIFTDFDSFIFVWPAGIFAGILS